MFFDSIFSANFPLATLTVLRLAVGAFGCNRDFKNVIIATFAITPSNIYDIISWFNFKLETPEWYPMKAYELYFSMIPFYVT